MEKNKEEDTMTNAKSATGSSQMIFAPARRVNQALTASIEKRALHWMAERAPKWLTSGARLKQYRHLVLLDSELLPGRSLGVRGSS